MAQMSDRGYLAMSLLMCIVGSLVSMNFTDHRKLSTMRTTIGLCIIGIGFVVGSRATANLFAKIIGISQQPQAKKIGELGMALGWISLVRMAAPFWNVALLTSFGPFGVFMACLIFFLTAFLLEIFGKETLIPHYSYLISK